MKHALERFKDLPELIFMVALRLDREDMHSLRLTCSSVHDVCKPLFYRKLWLHDYWSEPSLLKIAKHASSIHSLKVESLSFTRYYSCMFDILQETSIPAFMDSPIPTSPSPQLTNPIQLASILSRDILEAFGNLCCFPAQFLYSICPSPRLTILNLDLVMLDTKFELNFMAKVLSSIGTLRSLTMSFCLDVLTAKEVLQILVHGCPDSLESFSLFYDRIEEPDDYEDEELYEEDAELEETVSTLLGPMMERQEPLRRLTEWRLNVNGEYIDRDTFFSLLKFLPELTSMDMPPINCSEDGSVREVVTQIVKGCPKLKGVSKHDSYRDIGGTMMIAFLQGMPVNTVESVQISALDEDWEQLDEGLEAQKESVENIVLDECTMISIGSVIWIFFYCSALEVFRINIDWLSRVTIPLDDLVIQEWASTKFHELELSVQLNEEQEEPGEEDFVFSNPMPRWTIGLERFYRQIGALTQLRVLDLRVAVERGNRGRDGLPIAYKHKTFPGMMTLEDRTTGCFGWLQLLGGLGNLEVLCGSFNLDAMLPRLEFGQREADWVVKQWPKLKFIELYTILKDMVVVYPAPVQSMLDQLPGLKVARIIPKIDILWTRK
ncbi:hypothetical protein BG015_011613 [Linnemannia schmuckeri]|uniref:F-box domain-containing protein n=1 Tax=Linnemannia schmuckeri TaxID=64567 RepID=A0A9P5S8B0_9FUNG|nr:hypothetical protein BG015_011613 [Linnemannia schmuckeri]